MTRYISNTLWILGEKVSSLGISFLLSVWLARYLGAESFGVLSYGIALVSLFAMLGHLGLEGLAIRELVNQPEKNVKILITVFYMKAIAYALAITLLLLWGKIKHSSSETFYVISILAGILLFRPFDVIEYWFQSQVKAKICAIARIVGNVTSSIIKIFCILLSAGVIWLALAHTFIVIIAAFILIFFLFKEKDIKWTTFSPDWKLGTSLLKQGSLVFLGSMAAIIYLKIDQIMIEHYLGAKEVGIYSVAATLSEAWYFIPVAVMTSLFPKLILLKKQNEDQYQKLIQVILDCLCLLAISLALAISFSAEYLIQLLYGHEYLRAAAVLEVHIWAGIFIFMRALYSKWILIESLLWLSLVSQVLGAIGNIILNIFLIPSYGILGAAWATLISYGLASYFALWITPETRSLGWMMTKALFAPFRAFSILKTVLIYSKGKR